VRALVAGFGNVFFSDDGFAYAVIRALADYELPDDVRVHDFGIGGMHLALEMLEPYELIVLVDAIARDDPPGTLFLLAPDAVQAPASPDAHAMDVNTVLSLYTHLSRDMEPSHEPNILIVGCVPERIDEGMGLSEAVTEAIPRCAELIQRLVQPSHTGVFT
jgi:hydrogenase maturation protease